MKLNILGTVEGRLIVLNGVVVIGMVAHRNGINYGDHVVIAALCAELVFLAGGAVAEVGTRLAALICLIVTGMLGTLWGVGSGELVVVATMVVMSDIVRRPTA